MLCRMPAMLYKTSRITARISETLDERWKEETVSLKEVNEGDRLIVRSGDKMPTDGVILKVKQLLTNQL